MREGRSFTGLLLRRPPRPPRTWGGFVPGELSWSSHCAVGTDWTLIFPRSGRAGGPGSCQRRRSEEDACHGVQGKERRKQTFWQGRTDPKPSPAAVCKYRSSSVGRGWDAGSVCSSCKSGNKQGLQPDVLGLVRRKALKQQMSPSLRFPPGLGMRWGLCGVRGSEGQSPQQHPGDWGWAGGGRAQKG